MLSITSYVDDRLSALNVHCLRYLVVASIFFYGRVISRSDCTPGGKAPDGTTLSFLVRVRFRATN